MRLIQREGLKDTLVLRAAWQTGAELAWRFQRATRVYGFEFREPLTGDLLSIQVDGKEQIMAPFAIVAAAQWYQAGLIETSPEQGWKLGPIAIPSFGPGKPLTMRLEGFTGQVRPFGVQLSEGNEVIA